jgi:putrescine aminotransferase
MDLDRELRGMSERKQGVLRRAHAFLMPNRVEVLAGLGVPLVIGRREGYRIWDLDGHELMDFHLNGGTFNLGHRHPEIVATTRAALDELDIGNHHFPSESRALLAEQLARLTPGELNYSVFTPSGSEANDLALRIARHATGRRKVVSLDSGYYGHTGLTAAAGRGDAARFFRSEYPGEFAKVPFDDLPALEKALAERDVAAVLLETIPATAGFPTPSPDYLPGVRTLCEAAGTLYVADEVQTGLGRTGRLWGVELFGVEPDLLVTGKGLSGGVYPMAAVVMTRAVGAWLEESGWSYVSTFGGAEVGCRVASKVLELCSDAGTLAHARAISERFGRGLEALRARHPFLVGVSRTGLVMGLRFDHPQGAMRMSAALYRRGVWAMFAGFDRAVLQWKPGLLVDEAYCDESLERLDAALGDVERA